MARGDGTYEKVIVDLTVLPPAKSTTGEIYRRATDMLEVPDMTDSVFSVAQDSADIITVYSPDDFKLVRYVRVR